MEKIKQGYKQTDIGVIPEDWEVKPISEISTPVRGGSPRPAGSPKYFNGNYIPWLTVASLTNVPNSQIIIYQTATCLTEAGALFSRTLEKDTLIIANSGATLGVAKILGIRCCANDGIAALINISSNYDKRFILFHINSITDLLRNSIATGNGQPNLNTQLIGNLRFPFPKHKTEQTAIATALSDTDAFIAALDKKIAKKQQIKQGAMQQLLTGKKRLPGFSGEWVEKTIEEIGIISKGEQLNKSTLETKGKYPVINGGMQASGYTDKYNSPQNTITISEGGNSCGFVNLIKSSFWAGGHCYKFIHVFSDYDVSFLYQILKFYEPLIMDLRAGSGLPNIQKNSLLNFKLSISTDIREQTAIAQILTDMDHEIAQLENERDKYKELKAGMMQVLLTGKVRLV